jgi:multidrug resistance efflux pump
VADHLKAKNGPRAEEKAAARAAAAAARARLARLEKGYRDEEKRQTKSELASAEADEGLAREELARVARLRRSGASTQAEYDSATATYNRTRGRMAAAKARHDLMEAGSRQEDVEEARAELGRLEAQVRLLDEGTRPEEITAAGARLAEAKGRLAELEVNLREAIVRAVEPSVVELVAIRPGDLAQAGQPVVKVLRTGDLWVKTYVPETELGKVCLGQAVQVSMDSFPGVRFAGKVVHIGGESEFTPRNVQTVDERRHQMFGIRVKIDDPRGLFKSGMAAEVYVPVQRD